jgi:hypothetical protein
MYATSVTASSKPFGLFQDSGDSGKGTREANSQYTLRPRRKPRITQMPFPDRGQVRTTGAHPARHVSGNRWKTTLAALQGLPKAVVAETMPSATADSSASVVQSAGTSSQGEAHRKKRCDFDEQAELVDVLNMLSQLYRDQVCWRALYDA